MATGKKNPADKKKGDSWELIAHEEVHTRARSPQHKEANKSHAEIADRSSGPDDDFVLITRDMGDMEDGCQAGSDNTDSQKTSIESTASMDGAAGTSPTRVTPNAGLPLKKRTLEINERQPQHAYIGSVSGWLNSVTSVGDRYHTAAAYKLSMTDSMYTWPGNPEASMASSMSLDPEPIVPASDNYVCGTGMWIDPSVIRF